MLNSYLGGAPMKLTWPPIPPKKNRLRLWRGGGRRGECPTRSGINLEAFLF